MSITKKANKKGKLDYYRQEIAKHNYIQEVVYKFLNREGILEEYKKFATEMREEYDKTNG